MSDPASEGLLSRWSRRKLEAKRQPEADEALAAEEERVEAAVIEEKPQAVEEPVLTDEDMPPIESLTEDSDYSVFMSPGVSDKLRNLALRKMFHVPAFNIRDGLDEYDEDYTTFEALGDIVTCDMKHQLEMLEKKKKEQQEAKARSEEHDVEEDEIEDIDEASSQQHDDLQAESNEEPVEQAADSGEDSETDRHE